MYNAFQNQNDLNNPLSSNIKVIRFVIAITNSYNDQFLRPHETQLNASTKRMFEGRLSGLATVDVNAVASLVPSFMMPSATTRGVADIDNGWGERRCRFILEVETMTRTHRTREIITGYTNYVGISYNNSIDPQMLFYINEVSKVYVRRVTSYNGTEDQYQMAGSNFVIADNNMQSYLNNDKKYLITPRSVVSSMVPEFFSASGFPGTIYNAVTSVNNSPVLSKQDNSSAPRYIANVFDAYQKSVKEYGGNATDSDALDRTVSRVLDPDLSDFSFTDALTNIYSQKVNQFKITDLRDLDPQFLNNTKVVGNDDPIPMDTEHWNGSDFNTQAAAVVKNTLPSILMDCNMTSLAFTATNMSSDPHNPIPQDIVVIADGKSVYPIDCRPYFNVIINKIKTELIPLISNNGMFSYDLTVTYDMFATSAVTIGINGDRPTPFVIPSFCSVTDVPVLTSNHDDLQNTKNDFEALFSIYNDFQTSTPSFNSYNV